MSQDAKGETGAKLRFATRNALQCSEVLRVTRRARADGSPHTRVRGDREAAAATLTRVCARRGAARSTPDRLRRGGRAQQNSVVAQLQRSLQAQFGFSR